MSQLTTEEILKLARLARLKLSDEEIIKYSEELGSILDYVELLSSVDTSGLEPTNQVTGLVNVFRSDQVRGYQASPDQLLEIAPDHSGRYLKVKRMI